MRAGAAPARDPQRSRLTVLGLLALLALPLVPPAAAYHDTCDPLTYAFGVNGRFVVAYATVADNCVSTGYYLGDGAVCPYDPLHQNVARVVTVTQGSYLCDKRAIVLL